MLDVLYPSCLELTDSILPSIVASAAGVPFAIASTIDRACLRIIRSSRVTSIVPFSGTSGVAIGSIVTIVGGNRIFLIIFLLDDGLLATDNCMAIYQVSVISR